MLDPIAVNVIKIPRVRFNCMLTDDCLMNSIISFYKPKHIVLDFPIKLLQNKQKITAITTAQPLFTSKPI